MEEADHDISGDAGVFLRTLRPGKGEPPRTDGKQRVKLKYAVRRLSGDVLESGEISFSPGSGQAPVRGLDVGVRAMSRGETAELTLRADYAYGSEGRPPDIPPHATLIFAVELLEIVDITETPGDDCPALPAPTAQPETEDAVHTLEVGGAKVKVDKLGPMVVNADGSLSRITNWLEMSEAERQTTLRVIGKRNQQRLTALQAAGAEAST
eukprot:CAMPEP_0172668932 /NCGR_PEP_ID=MMETSP1074-20121228/9371_1 /TAXON_ID=2916 /ORGANISM="Ceratium fusus, Strain PA161109" /LENGTH=209 /DNA_ID=CAMNT_0013485645 /DNA_START=108 /DNA_END=737 /DNA_ORIENTATION=+